MTNLADSASTINAVIQDPIPQIEEAPDLAVTLMRGFNGEKTAIVREMTGADEEYLASLESRGTMSYPDYISALLKRTVESIGKYEVGSKPDIVDELIIGDRDILFIAVVKATYGKKRRYTVTCPFCNKDNDLYVDMDDDFPIQGTAEEAESAITVTLKNGKEVSLRLPTGGDAKYVNKKAKTIAEQNTLMISRCAQISEPNKEQWARNLTVGDRSTLINALLSVKIGPKSGEVNDPCPSCGEQIVIGLDWVSLLFG